MGTRPWADDVSTFHPKSYLIYILTHLKLCLATATRNFKWVEITLICLIWYQAFANLDICLFKYASFHSQ